ncbi:hypothetical protein E4T43_04947 [Aureobasidium subglaciale]|nr:hypothetical protein E4T43_04947 [Aureobasidium subglaciale]
MGTINDENAAPNCNINTKNTTTSNADFDDEQEDGFDDDFTYDEDDDIPLEKDPFFGNVQTETCPGQPTQEQLDFIARAVEEDKAKEAACGIPLPESPGDLPALESPGEHSQSSRDAPLVPFQPPHPLLNEQIHNAIELVVEVRSSYGGDVFLVMQPTEPLYEMKLKFIQTVGLDVEPGALQFFYNDFLIEDDHTAKKIGLTSESLIHCQKVGAMRYDVPIPTTLW